MKALAISCLLALTMAAGSASACEVHPVVFEGWQAEQVANDWVQLTFVPQLGGRLMQVTFNGHRLSVCKPGLQGKVCLSSRGGRPLD